MLNKDNLLRITKVSNADLQGIKAALIGSEIIMLDKHYFVTIRQTEERNELFVVFSDVANFDINFLRCKGDE